MSIDVTHTSHVAALSALPGMGPARLRALLSLDDASGVWAALMSRTIDGAIESLELRGVTATVVDCWARDARSTDVAALWERHVRAGVDVLLPDSEAWPIPSDDPDPPAILFGKGPATTRTGHVVAIVGTRRCTRYGLGVAAELGRQLAAKGVTVISGVANGVDGAAQRAAIDQGGHVVGVVGSGLDVVYPRSNTVLWGDIAIRGRLWSETPLGQQPAKWRFPARNRIIAALADVVVVVESGPSGGSLHTVDAAIERDRQVLAVPGPITSRQSVGTNRLLVQGCAPVTHVDDVMAALGFCSSSAVESLSGSSDMAFGAAARSQVPDDPELAPVLDAIGFEAASTDTVVSRTGLDIATALARLGRLQSMHVIIDSGGWWQRT